MSKQIGHAYYYAIGERYVQMAEVSAASLRRHNPAISITMFTDQALECGLFDRVVLLKPSLDTIYQIKLRKIQLFSEIINHPAIYLDCDTFITADIGALFSLVEHYDIAVAYDMGRHVSKPFGTHMNSGVVVFAKNDRTLRLWRRWQLRFEEHPHVGESKLIRDQPAFDFAIRASGIRMFVLAPEYNLRLYPFGAHVAGKVKIFHGPHGVMLDGSIAPLAEFINSEDGIRAFDWRSRQMHVLDGVGTIGNDDLTEQRTLTCPVPFSV